MCGIFGIVLKKDTAIDAKTINSVVDRLFYLSEFRGKEASGLAVKSTLMKEIGIVRKSCPGKAFIKSSAYKKFVASYLNEQNITSGISLLGHTRIATNGYVSLDNQPIVTHGTIGVHNGIICNIEELWNEHTDLERKQVIDTELLIALTRQRLDESEGKNIQRVLFDTDDEMEGMASFGMIFDKYGHTVVGSNCGSFHYINSPEIFVFSSEEYILSNIVEILSPEDKNKFPISQLKPISFGTVNEETLEFKLITEREVAINISKQANFTIKDHTNETPPKPYFNLQPESTIRSILENNIVAINKIKRCTRCILPETHPFIEFDENGVCNYCNDYTRRRTKLKPKGRDLLEGIIAPMKQNSGNNCIVLLSGGRDSCYALHLVKKELGLNPVAYSYDWGMLTDLGRRNQSRMCEKLGVEHIIVSADIKMKRRNIKLNVEAFLKKPHLGMIGLFMAGDKAYHHFAHLLNKRFNLPLIGGGCPLEYTFSKKDLLVLNLHL
ncbi:MAG: hypothetical protein IPN76_10320 [Saprospiraceae bacterium]|nr:hypothetical protein [Saprospiraceae bacterium]